RGGRAWLALLLRPDQRGRGLAVRRRERQHGQPVQPGGLRHVHARRGRARRSAVPLQREHRRRPGLLPRGQQPPGGEHHDRGRRLVAGHGRVGGARSASRGGYTAAAMITIVLLTALAAAAPAAPPTITVATAHTALVLAVAGTG